MIYHIFSLALIARETAPAAATKVKKKNLQEIIFFKMVLMLEMNFLSKELKTCHEL